MTDCNLALPIGFRKSAVGEHRKLLIRLFLELGLDRLIMKYLDTDICLEQRICPRSGNLRAELSSGLGKPKRQISLDIVDKALLIIHSVQ